MAPLQRNFFNGVDRDDFMDLPQLKVNDNFYFYFLN